MGARSPILFHASSSYHLQPWWGVEAYLALLLLYMQQQSVEYNSRVTLVLHPKQWPNFSDNCTYVEECQVRFAWPTIVWLCHFLPLGERRSLSYTPVTNWVAAFDSLSEFWHKVQRVVGILLVLFWSQAPDTRTCLPIPDVYSFQMSSRLRLSRILYVSLNHGSW